MKMVFEEYHHTGYRVVKEGRLVGIVMVNDLHKTPREIRDRVKVDEIASTNLVVTYPDETVHSALDKMHERNIGRLLVVERNNPKRILGIISKHEILHAHEIASERPAE